MSKKNKKHVAESMNQYAVSDHATEYRIIKHDLIKVVALNLLYLTGVLALYFTNLKTHYLEQWFTRLLHF